VELRGELPVEELDLDLRDELIQTREPLRYEIEAQLLERNVLVQGRLNLVLHCECARCLKPFQTTLRLDPWTLHLPLDGEEAAPVNGDFVDLTPYVREDILLEFPQHPLCETDCRGLPVKEGKAKKATKTGDSIQEPSAWSELDKLKLK
jgi:uncharacterized metal-binding protein YceD (DUF177 family)